MESISEPSLRFNLQQISYCRTTTAVLTGSTAGILGLTGVLGFVLYLSTAVLVSVILLAKAGANSASFFPSKSSLYLQGVLEEIVTYILFWTLLYGIVHVY
ncbi:Transmembrane protein 93 [Oopsacas minuta]|uniref:ER membrane protein complex subunit 6 n=1 Tax=Oopsacas minuta TaxID=111878 RepID=A0AAV7JLC4_9METZ|nr:Transmembrane protein 93 [Oopsacas minuta]